MSSRYFQPTWHIDGDDLLVILSPKRVYRERAAVWEEIWRAYSYDGQGLQVNQICRRFNIPRKTFLAVKEVVGLTHTSVPYPPWVVAKEAPDELVEKTLEQREEDYQRKLEARSPEWFKKKYLETLAKLQNQDRLVKALATALREVHANDRMISPAKKLAGGPGGPKATALFVLSDWHVGRAVLPRLTVAAHEFNLDVLQARAEALLTQIAEFYGTHEKEIREVVVVSLGDMLDDPMSMVFPNQAAFQDVRDVEQVRAAVEIFASFFEGLLTVIPLPIRVIAQRGNHGPKGGPLTAIFDELLFDPMLKNWFRGVDRIVIKSNSGILGTHRVGDALLAFLHGAAVPRNLPEGKAYRLAALAELANPAQHPARLKYLFFGHLHHRKALISGFGEGTAIEWIWCPSMVGGGEYAERTLFTTSRPAQNAFLIHPKDGLYTTRTFYLD